MRLSRSSTFLLAAFCGYLAPVGAAAQQTGTIAGLVQDGRSLQPLPAVQVFIGDLDIGVLSQASGRFLLANVPAGTHTVTASRIGYGTSSQQVVLQPGATAVANFELIEEALALDEVIVTGTAGGTQRRAIGNAVERVDVSDLARRTPSVSTEQILTNRIPGVQLRAGLGSVGGDGGAIRIRGSASLGLTNDPIVYVDGVRIYNDPYATGASSFNRINEINPNDIESIEVIKGPAAATIYGTEASNGVIQIITKRGTQGAPTFDASVQLGTNFLQDACQALPVNYAMYNGNLIRQDFCVTEKHYTGKDIFQHGPMQTYDLSVRGGTSVIRYFASGSLSDSEGAISWNYDKRRTGRMSLAYSPNEMLTVDVGLSRSTGDTQALNAPSFSWESAMLWSKPVTCGICGGAESPLRGFRSDPDLFGTEFTDVFGNETTTINGQMTLAPLSWLSARATMGLDDTLEKREAMMLRNLEAAQGTLSGWTDGLGGRRVELRENSVTTADLSVTASVDLTGSLSSATSAGMQYYKKEQWFTTSEGAGFPAASLTTVSATGTRTSSESFLKNATAGAYLQQQFGWQDRLFVTGAMRWDENSAFGKDYGVATYPKISATWVVNEEPFWSFDAVNTLRLRAAWGASGKQPDIFAAQRLFILSQGTAGANLRASEVGNSALGPERGEELELGFDVSLFADRVSLSFTHYDKTVKDALVAATVPPSMGFRLPQWQNIGEVNAWGTETALGLRVLTEDPVRWDVDIAFTTMKNKIVDLGGDNRVIPYARGQYHREGYPIAAFFNYKIYTADFVNGSSGPVTNLMCDGGTGDDGLKMGGAPVPCASAPLVYYGAGEPTWNFNISSTFTLWRSLQLSATIDGLGGHLNFADALAARFASFLNTRAAVLQNDPYVQGYTQLQRNPLGFYRGGFGKLRELTLAYTLSESLAGRVGASRASVSFSMRNVAKLWQENKWSPFGEPERVRIADSEFATPGANFAGQTTSSIALPPLSQAVLRVNLSFGGGSQ